MKTLLTLILLCLLISACSSENSEQHSSSDEIIGTWKMVYGDTLENDSLQIKDLSNTDFIKIINKDHFAFFNQPVQREAGFYGGGGTYTLNEDQYMEILEYSGLRALRGHSFHFRVEFKGDTLIQHGKERVEALNMDRYITEKYIRIK